MSVAQQPSEISVRAISCKDGHAIKNRKVQLYDDHKGVRIARTDKHGSAVFPLEGIVSWLRVWDSDVAYSAPHQLTKESQRV